MDDVLWLVGACRELDKLRSVVDVSFCVLGGERQPSSASSSAGLAGTCRVVGGEPPIELSNRNLGFAGSFR